MNLYTLYTNIQYYIDWLLKKNIHFLDMSTIIYINIIPSPANPLNVDVIGYRCREPAAQIGPIFLFIICTRINGLLRITIDSRIRPSIYTYINMYNMYLSYSLRTLSDSLALYAYNNFDRPRTTIIHLCISDDILQCRGRKHNFLNGNLLSAITMAYHTHTI